MKRARVRGLSVTMFLDPDAPELVSSQTLNLGDNSRASETHGICCRIDESTETAEIR
jgi:hypothetical protein